MKSSAGKMTPGSVKERRVLWFCLAWSGLLLLADQGSKILIENTFKLHETRVVVDGYFDIAYALNKGAAWSILEGYGWLLLTVAGCVLAAAVFFLRHLADGWLERYFAIFTVIAGIIGNSVDRIWRGAVVDFLSVHYLEVYHYPIFNIADCAICAGIGVFLLSSLLRPDASRTEK